MATELKSLLDTALRETELDFNINDNVIDFYGSPYWGAETKEAYDKQEKAIESYKVARKHWELYTWCDISGFDYWMKKQEEPNYLSITVKLHKDNYTPGEIDKIVSAVIKADQHFEALLTDYSHLYAT